MDPAVVHTFAFRVTDWTETVNLPLYDSSLGTLEAVRFELTPTLQGNIGYENLNLDSRLVTVQLGAELRIDAPLGLGAPDPLLSGSPQVELRLSAPGYDSISDFSGSSGNSFAWELPGDVLTATYDGENPLWEFSLREYFTASTPGESVDLPVTAIGQSSATASGDFQSFADTSAAADLTVSYFYDPIPEPSSLALLVSGLALLVGRRRSA
jgi:hypothetical protein